MHRYSTLLFLLLGVSPMLAGEPGPSDREKLELELLRGKLSGRIAFQSNRDGKWAIYTVNINGSGLKRLTDAESDATLPQWTSNNRKLAFLVNAGGRGQVCWMADDGSGIEKLTVAELDVKAFHIVSSGKVMTVKLGPQDWRIYRRTRSEDKWQAHDVKLKGLISAGADIDVAPSSNGRLIALRGAAPAGKAGNGKAMSIRGVYVAKMDRDGALTEIKRLGPGLDAVWSEDSIRLLTCHYAKGGCDVLIYDTNTGQRSRVSDEPGWEWTPAWSPRKDWIVYTAGPSKESDPATGPYDLYLRELPDGDPIRLTFHPKSDLFPSWRGIVTISSKP